MNTVASLSLSLSPPLSLRCQNPQYHLELDNHSSKDEIYLKIVIRRVEAPEKKGGASHSKPSNHSNSETKDSTIGK